MKADPKDARAVNPYLYENLVSNLESQIARWNQMALDHVNTELSKEYTLKAEGLQFALRLLGVFEQEIRSLTRLAVIPTKD